MVQVKGATVLTIGQLSTACGVPTSTIRFWERRGLLRPAARAGGQRRYTEAAPAHVGMLLLCQEAGLTIAEIRQILTARDSDPYGWRELVKAKMIRVEESLRQLNRAHQLLAHALDCTHEDITRCPSFLAAAAGRTGSRAAATANDPTEPDG